MTRTSLLMLPLMGILLLASCKKDDTPAPQTVKPEDAVALSKTIKVWHGQRTQGLPPSSGGSGPTVMPHSQPVKAVAGRYAIIKPEITGGDVAGYYVRVNGAQEYFKVDYSKPVQMERQQMIPRKSIHNKSLSRAMKIDSVGNGTLDSAIVITIPSSIQPGQFCLTYYAYDPAGNTGNPVTVCVTVLGFGGDASFNGTWHLTGFSSDTTMGWEPVTGFSDTIYSQAVCVNNTVVDTFGSGPGVFVYPMFTYTTNKADMTFGSNGGLKFEYGENYKEFDYLLSTCSNYVYISNNYDDAITGAWSYTSASNKMAIIFEFDDNGVPEAEAWEYTVKKIHGGKFYLYDAVDDSWLRFEK